MTMMKPLLMFTLLANLCPGQIWTLQTSSMQVEVHDIQSLNELELEVQTAEGMLIVSLDDIFWIRSTPKLNPDLAPWVAATAGMLGGIAMVLALDSGGSGELGYGEMIVSASLTGGLISGTGLFIYLQHRSRSTIHLAGMLPEEKYHRLKQVLDIDKNEN